MGCDHLVNLIQHFHEISLYFKYFSLLKCSTLSFQLILISLCNNYGVKILCFPLLMILFHFTNLLLEHSWLSRRSKFLSLHSQSHKKHVKPSASLINPYSRVCYPLCGVRRRVPSHYPMNSPLTTRMKKNARVIARYQQHPWVFVK